MEKRRVPGYADLMKIEDFKRMVDDGFITDDDGSGDYSDGEFILEEVDLDNIDEKYSHVAWFNK